jgi:hypothetical protein
LAKSGSITGLAAVAVTRYAISPVPSPLTPPNLIPKKLWQSPDGTWVFADAGAHRLYRQDPEGTLTVLAGFAEAGLSPDGTLASEAMLTSPSGGVADDAGNVFFAESGAHRIRVIPRHDGTLFGRTVTAGRIYTLAGTGESTFQGDGPNAHQLALSRPSSLRWANDGSLIFADTGNRRIRRLGRDGTLTTLVGGGAHAFSGPEMEPLAYGGTIMASFAQDAHGNLIFSSFADRANARIYVYCRTAGTYYGLPMRAGYLYALTAPPGSAYYRDGSADEALISSSPEELELTSAGDILIKDYGGRVIRRIDAQGRLTTLAGAMMPFTGLTAPFVSPPAPATAKLMAIRHVYAMRDGSILLWEDDATWRLTPVRP